MFFARPGSILLKKVFKSFTVSFVFEINLSGIAILFGNVLPITHKSQKVKFIKQNE